LKINQKSSIKNQKFLWKSNHQKSNVPNVDAGKYAANTTVPIFCQDFVVKPTKVFLTKECGVIAFVAG